MSSGAAVSNPAEWHIYPAGAHHKLTECSPSLHSMIEQHRFDLQLPDPNEFEPGYVENTHQWIVKPDNRAGHSGLRWVPINPYEAYQEGWTKATHAAAEDLQTMRNQITQAQQTAYLDGVRAGVENGITEGRSQGYKEGEKFGLQIGLERGAKIAERTNAKAEQLRSYWTAGPGSAPMHGEADQSPPAMNEAQAPIPPAPSAPQASHKCARAMLIVHNDGAETMVNFDNPIAQRGWKFRHLNGVPILVIGHGVPRRHIPLVNVKFMDLLSEDEL